jgi:phosphatidylinositol 3-kinase
MDELLKKSFQEYGFTTYKVMAMSKNNGIVEFIPKSKTIQDINNLGENPIKTYLEKNNNKTELNKKLENFRLSCVGYCVVTYILGIGDRHLENLMIKEDGKMFHIDFGFILGNDPKTYPPPFKICSQMIQAMGGKDSEKYKEFKKFCINAYWVLRDNARLIVNMFYLMIDSGILQINNEDTLFKLHDKFVPELSKSEAEVSFLGKLDDSVNALFPIIYDKVHSFMQYWRNK